MIGIYQTATRYFLCKKHSLEIFESKRGVENPNLKDFIDARQVTASAASIAFSCCP